MFAKEIIGTQKYPILITQFDSRSTQLETKTNQFWLQIAQTLPKITQSWLKNQFLPRKLHFSKKKYQILPKKTQTQILQKLHYSCNQKQQILSKVQISNVE